MFQTSLGIIGDIIPLAIFVYCSLILLGIIKPKKPIKIFENPSLLIKFGVFGGALIFLIIVILDLRK